jgi:hypothetical protein
MALPKVLNGARSIVSFTDSATGLSTPIGIFTSFDYSVGYDATPIFILGRLTAAEIEYTGVSPVSITASGWRTIDHGPHVSGKLPKIKDMLTSDYLTFTVMDRLDPTKTVCKITKVRATGYNTGLSAKGLQSMTLHYLGIFASLDDDGGTDNEPNLPGGTNDLP